MVEWFFDVTYMYIDKLLYVHYLISVLGICRERGRERQGEKVDKE